LIDDMGEMMGTPTDGGADVSMFGKIAALQTAANNIDGTAASVLEQVEALKTTLGSDSASNTVTKGIEDIKGLLSDLKKASKTIMDQGGQTNKIAQDMVNKLVEGTNKSLEQMGFIGTTIKKIDDEESQNRGLVQAKLDEIKTYLLSIKEATDTMEKKQDGVNYAVVQAWMEMEGG